LGHDRDGETRPDFLAGNRDDQTVEADEHEQLPDRHRRPNRKHTDHCMDDAGGSVKKCCVPIGSLIDTGGMGRPKNFNREGVLEKALPVFWRRGFADASLHELEVATGVNKSGLYSEFEDKEALFVQSLQYYLLSLEKKGLLAAEPLGWNNIERFLKLGLSSMEGQKGCFAVSSMREFAILPPAAVGIISRARSKLKQLIAKNIGAERPKMNADSLADLVLTFFTGLSMEHNLSSSRPSIARKIDDLMNIVRSR
jgi:AcrR family transcriptional regulator